MDGRVAGVLLAAGEGSRLGAPKALVALAGTRLVDRGLATLREGGADPLVVVTGAVDVGVVGAIIVPNPRWRTGMGSSLAAGLQSVPRDCDAAVVALVDQPLVGSQAVARLIAAHRAGAQLAVAAYGGDPRNPVLLGRRHWAGVLEAAVGDVGARPYLRARRAEVELVECGDVGSAEDLDTPADLARISAALAAPGAGG